MTLFKPRVGKVIFAQTTGGLSVIIPRLKEAIKAQVLADFIAEFTPTSNQQNEGQGAKQWVIYMDGSSTQHVGGIWIVLQSPERGHLEYAVHLQFQTTNNEGEYEALLQGLALAKSLEADSVLV